VTSLLFVNARQVVTCAGPARARRGAEMADMALRTGVAVLVDGDTIIDVAAEVELRRAHPDATLIDCEQGILTPGFVDSHTHAVFGRARYEEQ
jgi:imidazolonepropionase